MPSVPFPPEEPLLIVSPHLDDAVLACGALLAMRPGTQVLTVFAGIPSATQALTEWDRLAGFTDARETMYQRREEDRKAMQVFSAQPCWLDFLDSQYQVNRAVEDLYAALAESVKKMQPGHVFFPAGLFHSDHQAVHRSMLEVRSNHCDLSWWMYEDALYRRIPGLLHERLLALHEQGVRATPFDLCDPVGLEVKRVGVQCYASQLRALKDRSDHYADISGTERYWLLENI